MTIRRSVLGCRETSGPPEMLHGALVSVGRHGRESARQDLGTHEVRVHAVRLGGRSRLDASCVFFPGRLKGLLVNEALARKKFVAPPDAGRGWAEGERVRVREAFQTSWLRVRPAGLGLQALNTTEGVLGLLPVLLSPARRSTGPLARRSTSPQHTRPQGPTC